MSPSLVTRVRSQDVQDKRRELTPVNCPLSSTCVLWCMPMHVHTHMHTYNRYIDRWTDGQTDGQMDGQMISCLKKPLKLVLKDRGVAVVYLRVRGRSIFCLRPASASKESLFQRRKKREISGSLCMRSYFDFLTSFKLPYCLGSTWHSL